MGESMCSSRDIIISARCSSQQPLRGTLPPPPSCVHFPRMTQIQNSMKVRIPKKRFGGHRVWYSRDKRKKVFPASIRLAAKFLSPLGNQRNRNYREITISLRAPTNCRLKIPPKTSLRSKPRRVTSAAAYQYRIVEETKSGQELRTQRVTPSKRDSASSGCGFITRRWSHSALYDFFLLSSKPFVYYRSARTRETRP